MAWFKHKHKWGIIRTIWPYPEGYGTYCQSCKTVLDTGLTMEDAEETVEELNRRETERRMDVMGKILNDCMEHAGKDKNILREDVYYYIDKHHNEIEEEIVKKLKKKKVEILK